MFTVEQMLSDHYPAVQRNPLLRPAIGPVLRRLLREDDFTAFAARYPHLKGMDFVEQALEHFAFSYTVSQRERENIPPCGRVVIIANHPIGSLDGLALLKLIHEVRSDVRIVANSLLSQIRPLGPCLLPVNNMGGTSSTKEQLGLISAALLNEEAVIVFPAGEVSRFSLSGIKDGKWRKGFLKIAEKAKAPILPVHVDGRNSVSFYAASALWKPLSTALLVQEMFRQQKRRLKFTVGEIVPYAVCRSLPFDTDKKVKLIRKHLYRIGKGKAPLLRTESAVALPERRSDLKKCLKEAELLGKTPDGKLIFLCAGQESSPLLREIGRLRETAFRAVEEGTGRRRDIDRFDSYYQHLVLWDENDLEIVGAYRFTDAASVIAERGLEGLYTHSLFDFGPEHRWFLDSGLELGRSFVQPRYWGKRSLDYLWYGIGAFLAKNPQYRHLFGPVSISSAMPQSAKDLLIYFYQLHYGGGPHCSRTPFVFASPQTALAQEFSGKDCAEDFKRLKHLLQNMGVSVPPLYKQYAALCEPGGVRFLDFNVDADFSSCVDGLVVVDLARLTEQKRSRYIEGELLASSPPSSPVIRLPPHQ
ncbi:MAG: GNAT family N-acyltransferase [Candidatus Electronema sp. V4]|uniref:GNAT family N-acyltransferase n=1 Tax=Candidatus Electronema sp. V4 TaxID=3454756 RepID=UPI00405575D3